METVTKNTNTYLRYIISQSQTNVNQVVTLNTYKSKINENINVLTAIKAIGTNSGVTDIATMKTALANLNSVTSLI